jgi:nitric oxide reductase activation protein
MRTLEIPLKYNKLSPQECYDDSALEAEIWNEEFDKSEKEFDKNPCKETATKLSKARQQKSYWTKLKDHFKFTLPEEIEKRRAGEAKAFQEMRKIIQEYNDKTVYGRKLY